MGPRGRPQGWLGSALSRRGRIALRVFAFVGIAGLAFHLAHSQLGLGGSGADSFVDNWLYDGLILGSAVACLARGIVIREQRAAWLMLGAGLGFDAIGEIYYTLVFGDSGTPPIPSLADLFYLLYYVGAAGGLVLLARDRIDRLVASTWLDGGIVALTVTAAVASIAFERIIGAATHGGAAAIATNLAYPVGDLVLLGLVAGITGLTGWRIGRAWLLLGLGLALSAIADTVYLYQSAAGTYEVGGLLDAMWIASALATGFAAWQRPRTDAGLQLEDRRRMIVPGACALLSLGVLLYGGIHHVGTVGLVLAAGAVLLVFARAAWTFHENVLLLDASRQEAQTDALTGLGNRRAMSAALDRLVTAGPDSKPAVLVLFDLNGFKLYNDRFGHIAGDSLLAHLGLRLHDAVRRDGEAYRLGGDEFCVLLRCAAPDADRCIRAAVAALSADGDGFSVGASYGRVEIPAEASTSTTALRMADDRMYAQKGERRGSARQQTHDVLLGVLREREPDLHDHLREVGRLAVLVGRQLGLGEEELDELHRAAQLHDIGKAAVPDAILSKPGKLDPQEWVFIERHTLVGERILAAAPSLAAVAVIVRSSHENWDGSGYPDRLAGERIPLGARIVRVCDTFDAMTSERPYAPAVTPELALAELRRCAGAQFDPVVVRAFAAAWRADLEPRAQWRGRQASAIVAPMAQSAAETPAATLQP
jgi:two-component system, cell cycle response regulator